MFRRLTTLIALAVFAGVTFTATSWFGSARQKLVGHWSMSIEMNETDLKQMSPTENPIAAAFTQMFMKTVQADVDIVFRADDTATMTLSFLGNAYERHARWTVAKTEGDTATVHLQFAEGSDPTEWVVKFQDENSFQSTPPIDSRWAANKMVTFRRLKTS